MKRIFIFCIVLLVSLAMLTGCESIKNSEDDTTNSSEKPLETDYNNAVPVGINADILKTCYDYSTSLGYEIKDRDNYKSVLLGESNVAFVANIGDDKKDMVDENDFLIIFQEIRIVIDADAGVVIGTIPYV